MTDASNKAWLVSRDLMVGSQFSVAARDSGTELHTTSSLQQLVESLDGREEVVVFLDLTTTGPLTEQDLTPLKSGSARIRVVAFGPHVHGGLLKAANDAGCDIVMSRGEVHHKLAGGLDFAKQADDA